MSFPRRRESSISSAETHLLDVQSESPPSRGWHFLFSSHFKQIPSNFTGAISGNTQHIRKSFAVQSRHVKRMKHRSGSVTFYQFDDTFTAPSGKIPTRPVIVLSASGLI